MVYKFLIAYLFAGWHVAVVCVPQQELEQPGIGRELPCGPGVGPASMSVPARLGNFLLWFEQIKSVKAAYR